MPRKKSYKGVLTQPGVELETPHPGTISAGIMVASQGVAAHLYKGGFNRVETIQGLIDAYNALAKAQELVTTHLVQGRLPEGPQLSPREEARK